MTRPDEGPAARAGRILVVEDSPSARRLMQEILLRLGAELSNLRVAGTVVEALTLFAQWRPDVAFVDVELRSAPVSPLPTGTPPASAHDPQDGAELALVFLRRNPAIKVVVCSATDPSDPRVAQLVKDRKVDFIVKPVVAARVEAVLVKLPAEKPATNP
jgi:CheY-like chemotaxis protein